LVATLQLKLDNGGDAFDFNMLLFRLIHSADLQSLLQKNASSLQTIQSASGRKKGAKPD